MQKTIEESRTSQVHIVLSEHINGMGRLFGGTLMRWIDITAAVAARRHSGFNVTTAAIDHLSFDTFAKANDTVLLVATLTYVGNTSMEVRVDSFVEALNGERRRINQAYLTMVALDENERPIRVPRLVLQTPEEEAEYAAGKQRSQQRKKGKA